MNNNKRIKNIAFIDGQKGLLFPSKTNSSSLYKELGSEYFDWLEDKDIKDKIEYKKKRAP